MLMYKLTPHKKAQASSVLPPPRDVNTITGGFQAAAAQGLDGLVYAPTAMTGGPQDLLRPFPTSSLL